MRITECIYNKILESYSPAPPENGGIIGELNGVICAYAHDQKQQSKEKAIYEPDIVFLNQQIEKWSEQNIAFAGIIHSHLDDQKTLSLSDIEYAKLMFSSNPMLEKLFFPLIIPNEAIIVYLIRTTNGEVIVESDSLVVLKEGGD